MTRMIDLDLLRQATIDAMRVYEAVTWSNLVLDEAQQAVRSAETLLRETVGTFLPEAVVITDTRPETGKGSRETLLNEYIEVQKAYASFKDALYRLMEAHISRKEWDKAYTVLHALERVDAEYRDLQLLKPGLELARTISEELKNGRVAYAMHQLIPHLGDKSLDPKLRSVVDETLHAAVAGEAWDALKEMLEALHEQSIDIPRWLKDHSVPFEELHSQHIQWWASGDFGDSYFGKWLAKEPQAFLVSKGRTLVSADKGWYSLWITWPQSGLFWKFQLAPLGPETALNNEAIVYGVIIFNPQKKTQAE